MNDEEISKKLDKLETKIETILTVLNNTNTKTELQQYQIDEIKKVVNNHIQNSNDKLWRVVTPIVSAIIAAIMSLIIK